LRNDEKFSQIYDMVREAYRDKTIAQAAAYN
jgi:hypothetical protein